MSNALSKRMHRCLAVMDGRCGIKGCSHFEKHAPVMTVDGPCTGLSHCRTVNMMCFCVPVDLRAMVTRALAKAAGEAMVP